MKGPKVVNDKIKIQTQISCLSVQGSFHYSIQLSVYCNSISTVHPLNKYLWSADYAGHHARMMTKTDSFSALVEPK